MYSPYILYSFGLVTSLISVILWSVVFRAQIRQYHANKMNETIKVILMVFVGASIFSNLTPIWFDIYRLYNPAHPTNIAYAYVTSQYLYRLLTAIMFFVIYRY